MQVYMLLEVDRASLGGNMQTKCGVEFIRHNWLTSFYYSAGLIIGKLTSIFNMIDDELYCKTLHYCLTLIRERTVPHNIQMHF